MSAPDVARGRELLSLKTVVMATSYDVGAPHVRRRPRAEGSSSLTTRL
jgi:hypothetical protein